jgi:hypothetical protein
LHAAFGTHAPAPPSDEEVDDAPLDAGAGGAAAAVDAVVVADADGADGVCALLPDDPPDGEG